MSIISSKITAKQSREKFGSMQERLILAKLEDVIVFFPSNLVAEIFIIETSQLLPLPFYSQEILGCTQQRGQIIPLVSLFHLLPSKPRLSKEKLKVVRLGEHSGNLRGVGIVVDQLLGSQTQEQIPPELFKADTLITVNQQKMLLFQANLFSEKHWQPQYWQDTR